jgi:hypothetical protein
MDIFLIDTPNSNARELKNANQNIHKKWDEVFLAIEFRYYQ